MTLRILLTLLVSVFSTALTAAQPAPVPTVVSIRGKASVKMARAKDVEAIPLREGDTLSIGQEVKCEKGCREVKISFCRYYTKLILNSPTWIRITATNCKASFSGVRGGARKGEGITIISPRESEVMRPETFSFRWAPGKTVTKIKLLLKVNLGEEIFGPQNIDVSKGGFDPEPLALKLKEAQKAGRLSFVIIVDEGGDKEPESIRFNLISLDDQQSLDRNLEEFENESDLVLRAIARGVAFLDYELFTESVQEFEKALETLQRQKAVNKKTIAWVARLTIIANHFAYNDERAKRLCASFKNEECTKRLCASLKNSHSLPIDCHLGFPNKTNGDQ